MMTWLRRSAGTVLVLVGMVGLWALAVRLFGVESYLVPGPGAVGEAAWATRAVLPGHLRATATVAVAGLVVGSAIGIAVGAVVAAIGPVRRVILPLLIGSQSIPAAVLAPLFVVWFGFGTLPRVLVVVLVAFFPVAVATATGIASVDPDVVELVRSLGASRIQSARAILVPGALPSVFGGIRIAAAYATFGAVVGEWIGASQGLGIYLIRSQRAFQTDQVFVAMFLIAGFSVALYAGVAGLARLVMPWQGAGRRIH